MDFALAGAQSVDDLARHRWPQADWFDFSGFAERLEPWRDFAVMASGPSVFQHPTFLRRSDNLLMDMAAEAEMAHYLMDRFTDFYIEFFDRMLTAAQGRIDILRTSDDMGTQHGLFISPDMFRVFVLQGILLMIISIPLLAAQRGSAPLGILDGLAALVWLIGFYFEAMGDLQLARSRPRRASAFLTVQSRIS